MRLELGVDKQHTLFADKYADICKAIGSLNHMHAPGDWHDSELHIIEAVMKLGNCDVRGQSCEQESQCDRSGHILFPWLNLSLE
jgi:hypothetical protein